MIAVTFAVLIGSIATPMNAFAEELAGPDSGPDAVHNNGIIEVLLEASDIDEYDFPISQDNLASASFGISRDGTITEDPNFTYTVNSALILDTPAQQISQAEYNDGVVDIVQTGTTFADSQFMKLNFKFTNTGTTTIDVLKFGIEGDWDVDGLSGDTAVYDPVTDTAYVFDDESGTVYLGISSPGPSSANDLQNCCPSVAGFIDSPNGDNLHPDSGTADVTANLVWNLGSLAPGQMKTLDVIVAAGSDLNDLNNQIQLAKNMFAVVGGELIPIETTSLILAGAQSFSWMIPVVLSVLGIGLFVVSRKS